MFAFSDLDHRNNSFQLQIKHDIIHKPVAG